MTERGSGIDEGDKEDGEGREGGESHQGQKETKIKTNAERKSMH